MNDLPAKLSLDLLQSFYSVATLSTCNLKSGSNLFFLNDFNYTDHGTLKPKIVPKMLVFCGIQK